jgi:hypothetical protein
MAGDRRDLMRAATDFREAPGGGLAQAVRRYVMTTRRVAKLAKPVAEAVRSVGLSEACNEKAEVTAGRCVDDLTQAWMHGDLEVRLHLHSRHRHARGDDSLHRLGDVTLPEGALATRHGS